MSFARGSRLRVELFIDAGDADKLADNAIALLGQFLRTFKHRIAALPR